MRYENGECIVSREEFEIFFGRKPMNKVEIKSTGPVEVTVNGSKYEEKASWSDLWKTHYGGGFNQTYPSAWSVEVEVKPSYDRQQVLRGEYKAPLGAYSYVLLPDGGIKHVYKFGQGITDGEFLGFERIGCKFFPTRELAEEYKLIAEGKWWPKTRDHYCALYKSTLKPKGELKLAYLGFGHCSQEDLDNAEIICFPSASQRSSYIESKKPKMPTVEELKKAGFPEFPRHLEFTISTKPRFVGIDWAHEPHRDANYEWLIASLQSRAIADKIRQAEKARGEMHLRCYAFLGPEKGGARNVGCHGEAKHPGRELFYTKEGARLYIEAMGEDIKHLLL